MLTFCRLFYLLCLFCFPLAAIPSLTNRCGQKNVQINYPENVSTILFNKDCDTAFVAPPSEGTVSVDSAMSSTNLLFCNTVNALPKMVEAAVQGMRYWVNRIEQLSKEYDEVAKETQKLAQQLAELEPELKEKEEAYKLIKQEIAEKKILKLMMLVQHLNTV